MAWRWRWCLYKPRFCSKLSQRLLYFSPKDFTFYRFYSLGKVPRG